jgi:hypothetical protein
MGTGPTEKLVSRLLGDRTPRLTQLPSVQ